MKCSLGTVVRCGTIVILAYLFVAILIIREITRSRPQYTMKSMESITLFFASDDIVADTIKQPSIEYKRPSLPQTATKSKAIPAAPFTYAIGSIRRAVMSALPNRAQEILRTQLPVADVPVIGARTEPSLFRELMVANGHSPSQPLANYTHENLLRAGHLTEARQFCYSQLVNIYPQPDPSDCDNMAGVWHCASSYYSDKMSYCLAYNVSFRNGFVARLSYSLDRCPLANWSRHKEVEQKFYVPDLDGGARRSCKEFVDRAYVYTVNSVHIYFKVLCYYSIFETLLRNGHDITQVRFYRSPELANWPNMFADFEEKMFGKVENFQDVKDVCVREAHLVPNGYSTNPFRCKMFRDKMSHKCMKCEGVEWPVHALQLFKQFILRTCGLQGRPSRTGDLQIVFILRTPYERYEGDQAKGFSRILLNSKQVVSALKSLPRVNVTTIAMESLEFCAQVRLAWSADILMAVHGSALVHLWWTNPDAEVIEIEPHKQKSNPTFRMLSALTSTRYSTYTIAEVKDTHVALGSDFVNFVKVRVDNLRKSRTANGTYYRMPVEAFGKVPLVRDILYD